MTFTPSIGAVYLGAGRCRFRVWAPFKKRVQIRLFSPDRVLDLEKEDKGYWSGELQGVEPGDSYFIRLDDTNERPDPASFYQPEGVDGPSRVLDFSFDWHDGDWSGHFLRDYIFYELHVGTFT